MSSDERPEAPEPVHVVEHEGEYVRRMTCKLPAITLAMEEGYRRGTHLKMQVEVRVRGVHYDEIGSGKDKGELVRVHTFVLEEARILGAMSDAEADPGVGGSASQLVEHVFEHGPARDCYYEQDRLEVIHRGSCEICVGKIQTPVPISFQNGTATVSLTDAGF